MTLLFKIAQKLQNMLGIGNQNGLGMTFEGYWKQLTIAFKFLAIVTIILAVFGVFSSIFAVALANIVQKTVNQIQFWRPFTSFLVDSSILNVLINLYILSTFIPELQKKYSTVYVLIDIIKQNFYCNLVFLLLGQILAYLGILKVQELVSYGLVNVLLVLMWQSIASNPEEMTRFCCLPCIMPRKYLPWCFMLILMLQGASSALVGCLLGYFEYIYLKVAQNPIKSYHYYFQRLLPKRIKETQGFIAINAIQNSSQIISSSQNVENTSAFESILISGVAIGGNQGNIDYRRHWVEQEGSQQMEQSSNQDGYKSVHRLNSDLI